MAHEPMTIDTDDPNEALRQIANYLRTVCIQDHRAVKAGPDYDQKIVGYYQLTEWLQGLLEIAEECERIRSKV